MNTLYKYKWTRCYIFIISIFLSLSVFAQPAERSKVGLVLSGGGAKGFAHVGVLKVLEEYNIPVDYIGGTSIGSIVGGMYSVGYNSKQIEDLILKQDWNALFADAPQRIYMPFFEKKERDRYLIKLQIKDNKFSIPSYAIKNNGVLRMFSEFTVNYHDVVDFNELPTPFLCVAVDLVTGEEVVLDSGYLPEAMAASMAIPGVFPSVDKDSMVLIDGGMRNNFPVDHVRNMGADIIIGVDVGSCLREADDLKSFGGIVDQLTSLLAYDKFGPNREDCNVYIKPDISKFSASDFTYEAAVKLLKEGERVAREAAPEFEKLAKFFESYDFDKPRDKQYTPSEKLIKQIDISGSKLEDRAVLGIMGVGKKVEKGCSLNDLGDALERLKGSMKFSSINYQIEEDSINDYLGLKLELKDSDNNTINFGANYNTQDKVSLLFNGTFNTMFLNNSRASIDVKLSQMPIFEFNYNINRGSLPGLGFKTAFQHRDLDKYVMGVYTGEATISKFFAELNTNTIVKDFLTLGFGARYEHFNVNEVKSNFPMEDGKYNYLLYRFFFEADTKDRIHYPTKGLKYNLYGDVITDNAYELNNGFPAIVASLAMSQTFSLCDFYAITPSLNAQLEFVSDDETPMFYDTFIGGHNHSYNVVNQTPFWGIGWGECHVKNYAMISLENRFKFMKNHYAYLNANVMLNSQSLYDYSDDAVNFRFGMSVGYSYDSFLGPIDIYFSLANKSKLKTFINIGYYF